MKKTAVFLIAAGVVALACIFAFANRSRPVGDLLGEEAYRVLAISSDADLYQGESAAPGQEKLLPYLEEYRVRRVWLADQTYSIPAGETLYKLYLGPESGGGAYMEVYLCEGKTTRFDLHPGAEGNVRIYEAVSGEDTAEQLLSALKEMIG